MYTLGIDLHKKSSVWVIIDDNRKEIWKDTVLSHPHHVSIAVKKIPVSLKDLQVAVEPVGGWRWLSLQLEEYGMHVHIAHPAKIQLIAKSKKKTDIEDARTLALLLHSGFFPEAHRASEEMYQLRLLLRERSFIVQYRTSVKNKIHGISTTQGLHNILGGNPLHKKGKEGIMIGDNFVLKEMHLLIEDLDNRIGIFDQKLVEEVKKYPEAIILRSIPGVGIITSLTVIAEVDGFDRFKTGEKLSSFAGLVPRQRSSGSVVKYGSITRTGSIPLRTVLVETAMRIRESNAPELYTFVKRLTPLCGAKKARVALARKIAVLMWKLVTNNTVYNSTFSSSLHITNMS